MKKFQIFTLFLVSLTYLACLAPSTSNKEVKVDSKAALGMYLDMKISLERELKIKKEILIDNICKTIRKIESNNSYDIVGASGEYGAYQFMPKTWRILSIKYFGEILDIENSLNQDKVAKEYVRYLVNKGFNELQIASIWNSGSPVWRGKIGINKMGVKYNVPHHVQKFKKTYDEVLNNENYS